MALFVVAATRTHTAGFDLLLIVHVATGLFGFGAIATTAIQAVRLFVLAPDRVSPGIRHYFAPGVNWVGRLLYGVPILGFAMMADAGGGISIGDPWVVSGLLLWVSAAVLAEAVLWPAERRIQSVLASLDSAVVPMVGPLRRDCVLAGAVGAVLVTIFLSAVVIMVAQP